MRYTKLLFDLDGTLTDSRLGITETICRVLEEMGHRSPDPESLTWCVGPPLIDSLAILLGGDEGAAARALQLYEDHYRGGGMYINRVYDGVLEALAELCATGRQLAVVTGKPLDQACPILEHFGLSGYFSSVFGPTPEHRSEDKTLLLKAALDGLGADGDCCLYVGDRRGDVVGAHAHGIRVLGASYGYGGEQELLEAGAEAIAGSPQDWLAGVERLEAQAGER